MDSPSTYSVDWTRLGLDSDDFLPDSVRRLFRNLSDETEYYPPDALVTRCQPEFDSFDGTLNGRSGGGGRWFLTFSQVIGRFCDQVRTPETSQLLEFAAPLMCLDIMPSPTWKERDMGDIYYYAVISPGKVRQLIEVDARLCHVTIFG